MKKPALLTGLIALAVGLTAPTAMAADDYGVVNKTGMVITHLYMSPSNEQSWGDDILTVDVLDNNEECGIEFDPSDEECKYDIKIVDDSNKAWIVAGIDLCQYTKVTFSKQGSQVVFSAR